MNVEVVKATMLSPEGMVHPPLPPPPPPEQHITSLWESQVLPVIRIFLN